MSETQSASESIEVSGVVLNRIDQIREEDDRFGDTADASKVLNSVLESYINDNGILEGEFQDSDRDSKLAAVREETDAGTNEEVINLLLDFFMEHHGITLDDSEDDGPDPHAGPLGKTHDLREKTANL